MINFRLILFHVLICSLGLFPFRAQSQSYPFRIRTITAGVNLKNLDDTATLFRAISFLKEARKLFATRGYEIQTLRVATQNFYLYSGTDDYQNMLARLISLDRIAKASDISLSIGQIIPGNQYIASLPHWCSSLVEKTSQISFSLPVSSHELGIHAKSIRLATEIMIAVSLNSEGGEGNFRFSASANCPPNIPFFPAAYHEGPESFAIGLESAKLLTVAFEKNRGDSAREFLRATLEKWLLPIERIADSLAKNSTWKYDGIDASPAPGLDASIGKAIETYTRQPFGNPSTLTACALITDVLKNLNIKKCGYSGLMLPVIEDPVLAGRAGEGRVSVQELLLYSAVSGTGLDVVPLPGNSTPAEIENLITDVAALSLKYTAKALSARLFLIPGKKAGDRVSFKNPHLTTATVMKLE